MRKQFKLIILIFFILFLVGCSSKIDDGKVEVNKISAQELNSMMQDKDFVLIDVHIPQQERIKGTDDFIPYNEIENNLNKLPKDKDAKIVLYCRSGSMSDAATKELVALGYTNVYDLEGGTNAYRQAGYQFE
jgi:rhodanese-related sulfurtransferase